MQFEEFDNKIKEAAEHHHPAYDEQAWVKMEKLLDKHLPQKDDRRRRFIFFLLFLTGLGLGGLLIAKPWKTGKPVAITVPVIQKDQTATRQPADNQPNSTQTKPSSVNQEEEPGIPVTSDLSVVMHNKPASTVAGPVFKTNHSKELSILTNKTTTSKQQASGDQHKTDGLTTLHNNRTFIANTEPVNSIDKNKESITAGAERKPVDIQDNKKQTMTPVTGLTVSSPEQTKFGQEKETPLVAQQTEKKEKNKKKRNNSFFFSISTGPDVSFAEKNNLGTTKLLLGGGLGYTFNNRFTIRSGFYTARKIYTASPDAYHAPAIFYTYYPYLEKVDADCKVYEIPVSLSYRFGHSSRQSWFAGAGISSYLMKKEVYDYYYKRTPAGQTYQRKWTLDNENKHFLSGLTLSGGYQRKVNKYVSVMVEPYVKIPLSGVGYGKVKLYSGGVLLSVGINPFAAKKRSR